MPLTRDQRIMIANEVGDWMDAKRLFTAFEISRAVKAKGIGLRHREMKEEIHAAISSRRSRTYTRTLLDVGAPEQAWLYHPMTANPFSFQPLKRNDGRLPPSDAVADAASLKDADSPTATTSSDASDDSMAKKFKPRNQVALADDQSPRATSRDGVYGCSDNGDLKIPAKEMERLGVAANETVHVSSDGDNQTITICKPGSSIGDEFEVGNTNERGDFFVTHEVLEFVDLDWLACYQVKLEEDNLKVTEYSAG